MQVYLALADGAARFTQGFTGPALLRIPVTPVNGTSTGLSPSVGLLSSQFRLVLTDAITGPTTPRGRSPGVWADPRSLATTWGITVVVFSSSYLDVSVRKVRPPTETCRGTPAPTSRNQDGLPHSDIRGSQLRCSSPQLIAA
jgi:hypothetical protein